MSKVISIFQIEYVNIIGGIFVPLAEGNTIFLLSYAQSMFPRNLLTATVYFLSSFFLLWKASSDESITLAYVLLSIIKNSASKMVYLNATPLRTEVIRTNFPFFD